MEMVIERRRRSQRNKTRSIFSLMKKKTNSIIRKRTIIVGLKSDNFSRDLLLRFLNFHVLPFDFVLAVHLQSQVQQQTLSYSFEFDPNTFHMYEDLCNSKQVDFHVKVSVGSSYADELSHQVRITFASILVIGCRSCWPEDSSIMKLVKLLPPSCNLVVMDKKGKIVLQKQGTSQQGSLPKDLHQSNVSSITTQNKAETKFQLQKSSTMPSSLTRLLPPQENLRLSFPDTIKRSFERFAALEIKGTCKRYSIEELKCATSNFSTDMLIGEGGHSKVYRANFADGRYAAVKVLNLSQHSDDDLFQEVEILHGLKHENIVQILGFCYCKNMQAVVYNLLKESLRHKLKHLKWCERIRLAIGVSKALDYLHSSSPPIVHRDVKSSNILLSENGHPQLSDFGSALVLNQSKQNPTFSKPIRVVGTFGYLAPEYMMYGKVDEKIDVYSYGVVLLELITGKEAIQTRTMSTQESLVLWARSLLTSGLWERLIDPDLNNEYDNDEMKYMMIAARLCLLPSSKRPSIKMISHILEEPNSWMKKMHPKTETVNLSYEDSGSEFSDIILAEDSSSFALS